jgi:hypothetical protein
VIILAVAVDIERIGITRAAVREVKRPLGF